MIVLLYLLGVMIVRDDIGEKFSYYYELAELFV